MIAEEGIKEVVITGIHVASYGKDFDSNYKLIDLLEEINNVEGIERIRLGSIEPLLISTILRSPFWRTVPSIPILPNSFTITPMPRPDICVSIYFKNVVFPEPKNPETKNSSILSFICTTL